MLYVSICEYNILYYKSQIVSIYCLYKYFNVFNAGRALRNMCSFELRICLSLIIHKTHRPYILSQPMGLVIQIYLFLRIYLNAARHTDYLVSVDALVSSMLL